MSCLNICHYWHRPGFSVSVADNKPRMNLYLLLPARHFSLLLVRKSTNFIVASSWTPSSSNVTHTSTKSTMMPYQIKFIDFLGSFWRIVKFVLRLFRVIYLFGISWVCIRTIGTCMANSSFICVYINMHIICCSVLTDCSDNGLLYGEARCMYTQSDAFPHCALAMLAEWRNVE